MGKIKNAPILPLDEVDRVISASKQTLSTEDWAPGIETRKGLWMEWNASLELDLEAKTPEGLCLRFLYRSPAETAPEKLTLSLFYKKARIYGIDHDPASRHTNKVGKGRPYYGQRLYAVVHEHTWSADGGGYAEPLDQPLDALIEHFCRRTHIIIEGGCRLPTGQQLSMRLL